ncbi:AP-4 complex accessory subunit RUSC2 [Paramisgurnus dabryanus]|uniref:AP-4 complex accessory subunit RUSC2 n=1 Tax=Paramisgurnus dabryanus TaxID=90735 RepID=UPI0031F3E1B9
MDVSPKSRETLVACQISQGQGQSVRWPLYNSLQTSKPRPPSLNLIHSISLPERGNLPQEARENCSIYHTCKSRSIETTDKKGSADTSRYESSLMLQHFPVFSENVLLTSHQRKTEPSHRKVTPRWQNLFIPESEVNEDEEDEDCDGDSLRKYHEGSSLQLQGFNLAQSRNTGSSTECIAGSSSFSQKIFNYKTTPFSTSKDNKEQEKEFDTVCENCMDSKRTPVTFMDCDEQDWADEEDYSKHTLEEPDNCWYQTDNLMNCESLTENPADYITDSSCNSSDGVLVNFSAIYNKTNNAVPSTPLNLDSPDRGSGKVLQDGSNPMLSWSPHSVDPNSNIYSLDCDGFSSMEFSDLALCQGRLACSTQNYYKLVTCDLSSHSSPSPPWSSLTSSSETHSQGICSPPSEYFLFGQSKEEEKENPKVTQSEHQGDIGGIERICRRDGSRDHFKGSKDRLEHTKTHHSDTRVSEHLTTSQSQSWIGSQKYTKQWSLQNSCPSHVDTNLSSPRSRQHATSFAEIARCKKGNGQLLNMKKSVEGSLGSFSCNLSAVQKKNISDQKDMSFNPQNNTITVISPSTDSSKQSNPEDECASSPDVVRYTKAQRPTSLPIQPFVLQAPSGKQQSKTLGSLLNQYISLKYSRPGPLKAIYKSKGHTNQHSPPRNYSTIHLEPTPSSDTCSTCTSSPVLPYSRPQYFHPCTLFGRMHQNVDLMNRSPDQTEGSPKACTEKQVYSLSFTSTKQDANCPPEQVYPKNASYPSQHGSSTSITSVTSLTSIPCLNSLPRNRRRSLWPFKASSQEFTNAGLSKICHYFGPIKPPSVKEEHQHGDSLSRTDRPPEEFCLSPDAPLERLSAELLHKKSMLKALSSAVDLITAHFNSSQESEEKIRLGNSSLCTSILQLVFKHLCPTIQNILQDGLKAYKLDFIIGQRRNKLWNVIEATARSGSPSRMPDSLVSVVKKCSQLSSHSIKLYVFIMDLLNFRALVFWIHHLYGCVDIVKDFYHQWGFLALAQGPMYRPLFQELLLVLQPLSLLPFDLSLTCETQNKKNKQNQPRRLLTQSAKILQMSSIQKNHNSPIGRSDVLSNKLTSGYWLNQTPTSEYEPANCCSDSTHEKEDKEIQGMEKSEMIGSTQKSEEDNPSLRWARLFGSVGGTQVEPKQAQKNMSGNLRSRRPSEWLKIGASKVGLQS